MWRKRLVRNFATDNPFTTLLIVIGLAALGYISFRLLTAFAVVLEITK